MYLNPVQSSLNRRPRTQNKGRTRLPFVDRLLQTFAIGISIILASSLWANARNFYVSPSGSDGNPGTNLALPFQTIQHAASVLLLGDTCYLRAGVYHETITPPSSGSTRAIISFVAYSNEVVTVDAADAITNWTSVSNGIYQATVGWTLGSGLDEVFVDGAMVHQAQYPAYGSGDLFHGGTVGVSVNVTNPALITSAAWSGEPDNYWAGSWFFGAAGVENAWQSARVLSSTGNTITVDPATETAGWWFTGGGRGMLWGNSNFLQGDNEWFLQTAGSGNRLYLRLTNGENPANHVIEMKHRNWCVDMNNVNNNLVSGLNLWGGAVRLQGNDNVLQNCQAQFLSHYLIITNGYSENGNTDQGSGVLVNGNNNIVRGCTIGNTAGSGIITYGSNNRISRNVIYNTDYSGTYACCIDLHGSGDVVTFNSAFFSGRDVLRPEGTGSDIRFNELSYPGLLCIDLGLVYSWGIIGQTGGGAPTRVGYNYIHDNDHPIPAPLVYIDSWDADYTIDHNVIWNSGGDSGVRLNTPTIGDLVYNNTLFNCGDVDTYTYDSWPNGNPTPTFWTNDVDGYQASNNLFLANSPASQLVDWTADNFNLQTGAPAIDAGVVIPGFTDGYLGSAPDLGAYEFGGLSWGAGVNSWPILAATTNDDGSITLNATPDATYYTLCEGTNGTSPLIWTPVTNLPVASGDEWTVTLAGNPGANLVYSLQTNSASGWQFALPPPLPIITALNSPVSAGLGGAALFSVSAAGVGPFTYRWFVNGQLVAGATNSSFTLFPVNGSNTNCSVAVGNSGGSITTNAFPLIVLGPYPVAYWRMEAQITAPNNAGIPTYNGVADSDTNAGEGIYTTGSLPAAIDDLVAFNGLSGDPVVLSAKVPPVSMFVNGHSGGNYSYNAGAITNVDGCLCFPQDQYGDELDFAGPFTIELFFRTEGSQSGAGAMELFCQGTDGAAFPGARFRYGIDLNEAGAGALRFAVANAALTQTNVVDLTGLNYADGRWHYLQAICDPTGGNAGQLRLTTVNTDGTEAQGTNNLPPGFLPLPVENDGNAFVGRYNYHDAADGGVPRTFVGEIDEVQVISGVEPDGWRMGLIPTIDSHPQINNVTAGTNGVSFQWSGAAVNQFVVKWAAQLGNPWQTIATLSSGSSANSFVDTNPARLNEASGFYRVLSQ